MSWMKDHVYIATWLALPLAVIIAILKNKNKSLSEIDWSRILFYLAFAISLGVTFTPSFDTSARSIAGTIVAMGMGAIIVDMRKKPAYPVAVQR